MPIDANFTESQCYHAVIAPTKHNGEPALFEGRLQGTFVVGTGSFDANAKDGTSLPVTELRVLPDPGPYDAKLYIDADPGDGVVEIADNVRGTVSTDLAENLSLGGQVEDR